MSTRTILYRTSSPLHRRASGGPAGPARVRARREGERAIGSMTGMRRWWVGASRGTACSLPWGVSNRPA